MQGSLSLIKGRFFKTPSKFPEQFCKLLVVLSNFSPYDKQNFSCGAMLLHSAHDFFAPQTLCAVCATNAMYGSRPKYVVCDFYETCFEAAWPKWSVPSSSFFSRIPLINHQKYKWMPYIQSKLFYNLLKKKLILNERPSSLLISFVTDQILTSIYIYSMNNF